MRVRTLFTKGDIERCNDCQICRLHIDWLEFRNIGFYKGKKTEKCSVLPAFEGKFAIRMKAAVDDRLNNVGAASE